MAFKGLPALAVVNGQNVATGAYNNGKPTYKHIYARIDASMAGCKSCDRKI